MNVVCLLIQAPAAAFNLFRFPPVRQANIATTPILDGVNEGLQVRHRTLPYRGVPVLRQDSHSLLRLVPVYSAAEIHLLTAGHKYIRVEASRLESRVPPDIRLYFQIDPPLLLLLNRYGTHLGILAIGSSNIQETPARRLFLP